jgi:hypothetical protein
MRFLIGSPPDVTLELEKSKPLLDTPLVTLAAYGSLLGVVLFVLLVSGAGAWEAVYAWTMSVSLIEAVSIFALVSVIHELLHLVGFQAGNWGKRGTLGIIPKSVMVYAYYPFVVSRLRFVVAGMLPILVLSILPMLLLLTHSLWSNYSLPVLAINSVISGGDLVVLYVALRTPRGSHFQSSGVHDYYGQVAN